MTNFNLLYVEVWIHLQIKNKYGVLEFSKCLEGESMANIITSNYQIV